MFLFKRACLVKDCDERTNSLKSLLTRKSKDVRNTTESSDVHPGQIVLEYSIGGKLNIGQALVPKEETNKTISFNSDKKKKKMVTQLDEVSTLDINGKVSNNENLWSVPRMKSKRNIGNEPENVGKMKSVLDRTPTPKCKNKIVRFENNGRNAFPISASLQEIKSERTGSKLSADRSSSETVRKETDAKFQRLLSLNDILSQADRQAKQSADLFPLIKQGCYRVKKDSEDLDDVFV